MNFSEKWGTDVETAVKLALDDLKATIDEVNVTVLEEPSRGFFGIGSKLALVRVERKEPEPKHWTEEKTSTQTAKHVGESRPAAEAVTEKKTAPAETAAYRTETDSEAQETRRDEQTSYREAREPRETREYRERQPYRETGAGREPRDERPYREAGSRDGQRRSSNAGGRSSGPRRDNRGRDGRPNNQRPRQQGNRDRRPRERNDIYASDEPVEPVIPRVPDEELTVCENHIALDFLNDVAQQMGVELEISAKTGPDVLYIELAGKDAGSVIGKRGQTLDALQYLTSLVVNREQEGYTRVVIDAENYRAKRERTLEALALRLARKVVKTRRSVKLEPMNPYERKVIHATLQNHPQVTTRSEGQDPYRRVIIELKQEE